MASLLDIKIKHNGKSHEIKLDLNAPGAVFKQQIFELTGVPTDKVKVVVKGGMLKDDADLKKLGIKAGQTIMVIGSAGALPSAPVQQVVFMEDMTDLQLAQAVKFPVGLQNLGNTCYMNATIQVLRSIPELQTSLNSYRDANAASQQDAQLTTSLRDLYRDMSRTTEDFPPMLFLNNLRQLNPQFAERSRSNGGFSQQDAQEAWITIVNAVKNNLNVGGTQDAGGRFVEQYMTVEMEKTLKCVEAPEEPATASKEKFLEVKCNISATTNYMISGIQEALDQEIEKNSPLLGRSAIYQEKSRITRLPAYLTVNLVRFFWRREINKKTKIMRKVKFPFDLDVCDLLSDELRKRILPVNEKLKEIDKDRRERAKVRRRAKVAKQEKEDQERGKKEDKKLGISRDPKLEAGAMAAAAVAREAAAASTSASASASGSGDAMVVDEEVVLAPITLEKDDVEQDRVIAAGELVDEPRKRAEEVAVLRALVDKDLAMDVGANCTGMYELIAIVTHKGASADGGHYVGWAKRTTITPLDGTTEPEDPDKCEWYKFDDDKVSVVSREKITSLDGGGEDHTAYILLYASKKIE